MGSAPGIPPGFAWVVKHQSDGLEGGQVGGYPPVF